DYLEHARGFLTGRYTPIANAAWQWDFGYGWTMVPASEMQAFVSAQTYALRYFGAATGLPEDRFGFAWAPRNASALPPAAFAVQTRAILDRLAIGIRDSGDRLAPFLPGSGACGRRAGGVS